MKGITNDRKTRGGKRDFYETKMGRSISTGACPARGEVNDVHGEGSGWNRVLFEMRLQKGGPISSVMRTSINTKEELTVF